MEVTCLLLTRVQLSLLLPLKDVIVCPKITKSLLSVSKVTKYYPCSVKFDDIGVSIKEKTTKLVLARGRKSNGLYRLENKPQIKVLYSSRQQSATDAVWHRRLGHRVNLERAVDYLFCRLVLLLNGLWRRFTVISRGMHQQFQFRVLDFM